MAYIENPIVEGKDFESVMNDVNGNFGEIKTDIEQNLGKWECIGEASISGVPDFISSYSNSKKCLGGLCCSIDCNGLKYEKIYLIANGTKGSNVYIKTNFATSFEGEAYYPDIISSNTFSAYFNVGENKFATGVNTDYYYLYNQVIDDKFKIFWFYNENTTPDTSDMTFKLYGLKKPQWLLDALEIT